MRSGAAGRRAWGLTEATHELLDTTDGAEVARRDRQVNRAITAFLARPDGSVELDEALADQRIILAHHFQVPREYFTDPVVGARVAAARRHPAEPAVRPAASSPVAEPVVPGARRRVGAAALAVGVLAGVVVGGAGGYLVGTAASRSATPVTALSGADAGHPAPAAPAPRAESRPVPVGVAWVTARSKAAVVTGPVTVLRGGLLLADDHLVTRPAQFTAVLDTGATRPARLVDRDPATGVAVLAVDAAGLLPAAIGDSGALRVGERVVAVGAARDRAPAGRVVRALNRSPATGRAPGAPVGSPSAIEVDAPAGGPLLDARGAVIGIGSVVPGPAGNGYVVPIEVAVRAAGRMIAGDRARQAAAAHRQAGPGAAPAAVRPSGRVVP